MKKNILGKPKIVGLGFVLFGIVEKISSKLLLCG